MICHSNSLTNDFLKRNRTSGAFQSLSLSFFNFCLFYIETKACRYCVACHTDLTSCLCLFHHFIPSTAEISTKKNEGNHNGVDVSQLKGE